MPADLDVTALAWLIAFVREHGGPPFPDAVADEAQAALNDVLAELGRLKQERDEARKQLIQQEARASSLADDYSDACEESWLNAHDGTVVRRQLAKAERERDAALKAREAERQLKITLRDQFDALWSANQQLRETLRQLESQTRRLAIDQGQGLTAFIRAALVVADSPDN